MQEPTVRPRFRRRRFLVDPSHQVRVGLAAVGITLVLLILLGASLLVEGTSGEVPEGWGSQGRIQAVLVAAGSLVFLAGVFVVSILETHRTAGAARSLRNTLDRFRAGDLKARARLRSGDNLQEVAAAFNALAGELHEKRRMELERLETLADLASRDPAAAERFLRDFVEQRRNEVGDGA